MKNMTKGKKRALSGVSATLVIAIVVTMFSNVLTARSKSLTYIEQIKSDYANTSFKILEISPSGDNGNIGYYIDGEEPISSWKNTLAGFASKSIRTKYIEKLVSALKDKKLLSSDPIASHTTPLRQGAQYNELYPWESLDNPFTKTVTKAMREAGDKATYSELELDAKEKLPDQSGYMIELNDNIANIDMDDFEYNAVYKYRLADTSELNYYDYDKWYQSLNEANKIDVIKGNYKTSRVVETNRKYETISVFGTTEDNWSYFRNMNKKDSEYYDLNNVYAQGDDYYSINVEAGTTYKVDFKVKTSAGGKGQITVIPYTEEGKTMAYSPNYSKQYWYLNKYVTNSTKASDLDADGYTHYTYYFTTTTGTDVSYIQVRFNVAETKSWATFKDVRVNKFVTNNFSFSQYTGNSLNLINTESGSTASITKDVNHGRLSVKLINGVLAKTPTGGNRSLYYIPVTGGEQYVFTYHVENSMDDGGQSVIRLYEYDKDINTLAEAPKKSSTKGYHNSESGTYSVVINTDTNTQYIGVSFGVESKTTKKVSHTAVFSNLALVKEGDFEQAERPTHVQEIHHFNYEPESAANNENLTDDELGDNIFNMGEWLTSRSSDIVPQSSSHGIVEKSIEKALTNDNANSEQYIKITCFSGYGDVYTNYVGEYYSGFYYMKVSPGMSYKVSYNVKNSDSDVAESHNTSQFFVFGYDSNKEFYKSGGEIAHNCEEASGSLDFTFTAPVGVEYIQIRVGTRWSKQENIKLNSNQTCTFSNIQIRPYDQTSYYYSVKPSVMDTYYVEKGRMGTEGFIYDETETYYYYGKKYTAVDDLLSIDGNTEIFVRNMGYVSAGIIGMDGFVINPEKQYYKSKGEGYEKITDVTKETKGTQLFTYDIIGYTSKGKIDELPDDYDQTLTYYTCTEDFYAKPLTEFVYQEKVYVKSGEDYILTGTIVPQGFTIDDDTVLYTKTGTDEYEQISNWSKVTFGTITYEYFYDRAIYELKDEGKTTEHYEYVGTVGKDYYYAGTYGQDEFQLDSTKKYYKYDSEIDQYIQVEKKDMEPGMTLFTETTVFQGVGGTTFLDKDKTYYFLTVDYESENPVSAVRDTAHPYKVSTSEFRLAEDSEQPFFIEDGINYYTYEGAGKGEYMYIKEPYLYVGEGCGNFVLRSGSYAQVENGAGNYIRAEGNGSITIETDTILITGGFENNNWFLSDVFNYSLDEIASGETMGLSVDNVDPSYLNKMTEEDLEAYIGQFDMIVITPGLGLFGASQFSVDLNQSSYDLLYEAITGSAYTIPAVVDTALFNIGYTDKNGIAISKIPALAKALCEEETAGGIVDNIYRFNSSELPLENRAKNESIANSRFNAAITTYGPSTSEDAPYYDVYSDIITEKQLLEPPDIPELISEATCIRTILNYRGRRRINNKDSIVVLEVQPYTASPATTDSTVKQTKYKDSNGVTQKISSEKGLTKEEVLSWFPEGTYDESDITIKTMASAEFIGHVEDLTETYDILYIGASLTNMNYRVYGEMKNSKTQKYSLDEKYEKENGVIVKDENGNNVENGEWQKTIIPFYNDETMDGMYYTNIGDTYVIQNAEYNGFHTNDGVLGGLLESDYHYANQTKGGWELVADDESNANSHVRARTSTRSSGNDLTLNKSAEVQSFIDAGHPVVISSTLCDSDWQGELSVGLDSTVEKQADGSTYAVLTACYDVGKVIGYDEKGNEIKINKLPTGVQPVYTWYYKESGKNAVQIKETDTEYKRYVTYKDVNGDGLDECIYKFPLNITKVDERYNREYYCQISSFKFNGRKYQSLSKFTKPTSRTVKLTANSLTYDIYVERTDKNNAYAKMTLSTTGASMHEPVNTSGKIYSNEYTIQTVDEETNTLYNGTSLYYSWRSRSTGGSWRESAYCNYSEYEYIRAGESDPNNEGKNAEKNTYYFKFNNSDKKIGIITIARPYVDLKIDIISNKFGNIHIFTNAQNAYCNQLNVGRSYSYSRTVNYPEFVQEELESDGKSGDGNFEVRSERVDNSSNMYSVLSSNQRKNNVFSSSDFTFENNQQKLLSCVNVSKPIIEVLDNGKPMKIYGSTKTVDRWDNDNVIDVQNSSSINFKFRVTNPTDGRIRSTKYKFNVYIDLDGDGKFAKDEMLSHTDKEYIIKETLGVSSEVTELKNSWTTNRGGGDVEQHYVDYELQIRLGGDYIGILPWKLEITKIGDSTVHNSFTGYAYRSTGDVRYELNVLQILPMTVDVDKGTLGLRKTKYYKTRWDPSASAFKNVGSDDKCSLFLDDVFGELEGVTRSYNAELNCLDFTVREDYVAHIYITSVYDLQYNDRSNDSSLLEVGCDDGITRQSLFDKMNKYDMLIVGFNDMYAKGFSEELAQAISDYIDTGKSVLYTHDATDQNNNYYPPQRQADGYYLNLYVRDGVGQDKYGITYNILAHSETNRSKASRSKANSPARYGYTNNIYTASNVLYHYNYTPASIMYYKGDYVNPKTGAKGGYVTGKDSLSNELNGVYRRPAIATKEGGEWTILYDQTGDNPLFIADYETVNGKVMLKTNADGSYKTIETEASNGTVYTSKADEYGEKESQAIGVYVYYSEGKWNIGRDANGNMIFYDTSTYTGWTLGYDAKGHVITSENAYPADLTWNSTTGKWEILMDNGSPVFTKAKFKSSYGDDNNGTWHGAYIYVDQIDMTWQIGYDAKGEIITYNQNAYDVGDPANSPSVSYALYTDPEETRTTNIDRFKKMGYQIAYKVNTACAEVVGEVQGFTSYTMARYERGYSSDQRGITEYFNENTGSKVETTKVSQVNKGQITMYPFNLNTDDFVAGAGVGSHLSVKNTHEQYYTLNQTGSDNGDGTYDNNYATVWYCLGGNGFDDNVKNDCTNAYYLYRFNNVTYTGAGHENGMSLQEAQLFINVIIASHIKTGDAASIVINDADSHVTTSSIIVRCSEEEEVQNDGTIESKTVPDIKDEDNRFELALDNVQSNVEVKIWYTDSDGNTVEIYYDEYSNPHTVTYNSSGFIIKVDGEGPVSTHRGAENTEYRFNYQTKGPDGTVYTKTAIATFKNDDESENGLVSAVYKNKYGDTRKSDISTLTRLRQDLNYVVTVYDDSENPVLVERDYKKNIVNVNGDTSSSVCNAEYIASNYWYDKAKTKRADMSTAVGRPKTSYTIEYSIPTDVYNYLAGLTDASLSLNFQVLSLNDDDAIYKSGKVSDISLVKLGLKYLV